jgi:hypothetical protein
MSTLNQQPGDDWSWQYFSSNSRPKVPENTPQPINVKIEGEYISIVKQDVAICKFHRDDADSLLTMARLLTGMHRAGMIFGEMEHLKDIVCDFLREANGS